MNALSEFGHRMSLSLVSLVREITYKIQTQKMFFVLSIHLGLGYNLTPTHLGTKMKIYSVFVKNPKCNRRLHCVQKH